MLWTVLYICNLLITPSSTILSASLSTQCLYYRQFLNKSSVLHCILEEEDKEDMENRMEYLLEEMDYDDAVYQFITLEQQYEDEINRLFQWPRFLI